MLRFAFLFWVGLVYVCSLSKLYEGMEGDSTQDVYCTLHSPLITKLEAHSITLKTVSDLTLQRYSLRSLSQRSFLSTS